MKVSSKAQDILNQISGTIKLGDLRTIAKEIKKDHPLALELWSSGKFLPRQLAILIMDNKQLTETEIDRLTKEIESHPVAEQTQLIDWLMANQLSKDKKMIAIIESWENSVLALQRRIFWYHQGRLRWVGQEPPLNTKEILTLIEKKIAKEDPVVQWAMNFTAGWIGVYDKQYRKRCIEIGEKTGLYKGDMVSKNCTPNYLPEFIEIERNKRGL